MSTQPKTERRMNNPLRWLVLALMATASACVPPPPIPDMVYAVPDRQIWLEYRPTEPKRYLYGIRIANNLMTYVEVLPEAFSIMITNPTDKEMVVRWDMSVVVIDGESHPALMVREGFDCRQPAASPSRTVIPPGQQFNGYVVAADRVAWKQFSQEINEKEYPPGYWLNVGLNRLFHPDRPELHGGYCERKDFFPLSLRARANMGVQRQELEALKGRKVALYLRVDLDGEKWKDNFEFEARRVVDVSSSSRCYDKAGFIRYVAAIRAAGNMRGPLKDMTIKECGYEYE